MNKNVETVANLEKAVIHVPQESQNGQLETLTQEMPQVNIKVSRVYISNLNYQTTEEELLLYLKEYNPISVLIPSQTVRGFRNKYLRPLGIAYAEFLSSETAQKVIDEKNLKPFKDRDLRFKNYIPYSPNYVVQSTRESEPKKRNHHFFRRNYDPPVKQETLEISLSKNLYCDDTIYCAYLPGDTTDTQLRHFFKEYNPQEIWIFRTKATRGYRFRLHRYFTAALVTLNTEVKMNDICKKLSDVKLMKKYITLRVAFKSKLEEVKQIAEQSKLITQQDYPLEDEQALVTNDAVQRVSVDPNCPQLVNTTPKENVGRDDQNKMTNYSKTDTMQDGKLGNPISVPKNKEISGATVNPNPGGAITVGNLNQLQ